MSKGSTESWGSIPECRSCWVSWWVSAAVTLRGRPRGHGEGTSEVTKSINMDSSLGRNQGNQEVTPRNQLPHSPVVMAAGITGRDTKWDWTKQKMAGPSHHTLCVCKLGHCQSQWCWLLMWPPHPTLSLIAHDSLCLLSEAHPISVEPQISCSLLQRRCHVTLRQNIYKQIILLILFISVIWAAEHLCSWLI